jgi:hypothetical protein
MYVQYVQHAPPPHSGHIQWPTHANPFVGSDMCIDTNIFSPGYLSRQPRHEGHFPAYCLHWQFQTDCVVGGGVGTPKHLE